LGLPRAWSLIYFWNPLVVVEFAYGAHIDAWMILLMVASLWTLIALRSRLLSAVALAAATLTKGLPALFLPVLARRWRRPYVLVYLTLIVVVCLPFGLRAGWGLSVPPNGEGLLGALLIYGAYWNFNSGLYHWLEVLFAGYFTPNPVPQAVVGWLPIYAAKVTMALGMGGVLLFVWRKSQGLERLELALERAPDAKSAGLRTLRLAIVPLTAYLLLATTVHPWYATWIVPLLPFWGPVPSRHWAAAATAAKETKVLAVEGASPYPVPYQAFLWPLLYLSLVLPLSYLSYLDPTQPREYALVRAIEYVPVFLLLLWAVGRSLPISSSPSRN
jgi:hypothetical protein